MLPTRKNKCSHKRCICEDCKNCYYCHHEAFFDEEKDAWFWRCPSIGGILENGMKAPVTAGKIKPAGVDLKYND